MSKPRYEDLVGQKFNKLCVVEYDHSHPKHGTYWRCLCDCGNNEIVIVSRHNLKGNSVLSCGCLNKEAQKKRRKIDLIGQKINQLTVIGYEENENKDGISYLCKCDCGNDKIVKVIGASLKNGKTKSCGCFRAHRLPEDESAFNRLYSSYKTRAIQRKFEFDFTKEEFKNITKQNCYYCGCEPQQKSPPNTDRHGEHYIYNGVDRLDNSIGYTLDNSVACCGFCNVAKNNHGEDEFLDWVKRIYNNLFGER